MKQTCRRRFGGYFTVPGVGNSRAPAWAFCAPLSTETTFCTRDSDGFVAESRRSDCHRPERPSLPGGIRTRGSDIAFSRRTVFLHYGVMLARIFLRYGLSFLSRPSLLLLCSMILEVSCQCLGKMANIIRRIQKPAKRNIDAPMIKVNPVHEDKSAIKRLPPIQNRIVLHTMPTTGTYKIPYINEIRQDWIFIDRLDISNARTCKRPVSSATMTTKIPIIAKINIAIAFCPFLIT